MLIINNASAAGTSYWQRSAAHTAWLGHGASVLGLAGPVDATLLRDVLLGHRPGSCSPLTKRPALRRRHGWDLVFAAPKSVSLLALAGNGAAAGTARSSFRAAVADAFAVLEDNAARVRARGGFVPAAGVVAGAFEHETSASGQPHLHTHVVLANLGATSTGGWACLVGNELWHWRQGLGPAFQLALRSHMRAGGLAFEWELGPGGLGEIAGLAGRAAASTRSLSTRAGARSFGSSSALAGQVARATSRRRERVATTSYLRSELVPAGAATSQPSPPRHRARSPKRWPSAARRSRPRTCSSHSQRPRLRGSPGTR